MSIIKTEFYDPETFFFQLNSPSRNQSKTGNLSYPNHFIGLYFLIITNSSIFNYYV